MFARYLEAYGDELPSEVGPSASELVAVLEAAIVWGYNLLARISCPNGLVSNW